MDIKKYEIFMKVAELESFTKVGGIKGYTQSGISHMIKSFENEIGFPVVRRTSKGISLNDNGIQLLPALRNILQWHEQLQQTISSIRGLITGNINIGAFASVSIHWLPRIIKTFQKDYPGINITLYEGGIQEIDHWLTEGIVDIAFFSRQPHHAFEWTALKEDPLLAVLPKDWPLPEGLRCPVEYFSGKSFIMPTIAPSIGGFDSDVSRVLKLSNVTVEVRFSSKDDYAVVSMVESGLGATILPELVLKGQMRDITTMELNPAFFRSLGVAFLSMDRISPAAKKFLEYTKLVLTRYGLLN